MGASIPVEGPIDLDATLHSGQCFRWRSAQDSWHEGFIRGRPARLRVRSRRVEWDGAAPLSAADVAAYLRLDGSHERFLDGAPRDEALRIALARFPGLRMLRQDPWEVFVGYILSANSNVAKISRTIEALSRRAGKPIRWHGQVWHALPSPGRLAELNESELRATGMGYRAPHLQAAARIVAAGAIDLARLSSQDYATAHERLVQVPGIGPKVADCILLYGCDHLDAFPTDVWIRRVVREVYFPRKKLSYAALGEWARGRFGPWTGYAQHYLFHYRRVVGRLPRVVTAHA